MKITYRSIILIIITIIYSSNANSQIRKPLTITGKIEELPENTRIYLIENKIKQQDTIATVVSKNGRFVFKEPLYTHGGMYFVKIDTTILKLPRTKNTWTRILTNERNIQITSDVKSWPEAKIKGNEQDAEYIRIAKEFSSIEKNYKPKIWDANADSARLAQVRSAFEREVFDLLSRNGKYYGAAWFSFKIHDVLPNDKLEQLFNTFPEKTKSSFPGVDLQKEIKLRSAMVNIREGMTVPNFQVENKNGEVVNIHQLIGNNRLTLIDFWASWCSPCKAAFPKFKELYKKYNAEGFNIIGISTDKSVEAWKSAVNALNLLWVQMIQQKNVVVSSDVFGLETIPGYLLIDQNGKMIAFSVGLGKIEGFGPSLSEDELEATIVASLKSLTTVK